jgi:ABC-2 type transport system ATP-binding protein
LLRITSGLLAPDAGQVRVAGLDPEKQRRQYQRRIGFLSAGDRGLYPRLSVRAHLEYWVSIAFVPRRKRPQAVETAIEHFGLQELADRRVDRMSLGQRQRLRLAMTFIHEPEVVFLDEPRNSLDTSGAEVLLGAIERLTEAGGTAIWCSPIGDTLEYDFDRQLVIDQGRLTPA